MEINSYVCDQPDLMQVAIDIWSGLIKILMTLIVMLWADQEMMEPNKILSNKIGND